MLKKFFLDLKEDKSGHILVLDIGTTGIKAILFDRNHRIVLRNYKRLNKNVDGKKVEQDPEEILSVSVELIKATMNGSGLPAENVKGISITNQRETCIVWNKETGKAIYPAIVWEDTRTSDFCENNKDKEDLIRQKTGLKLDPYFSATKMAWILSNVPEAQSLYQRNNLLAGTVDSWVLWKLGKGHPHKTDFSNASRTLLFNIEDKRWDPELMNIFGISPNILPEAVPSKHDFGRLNPDIFGYELPILAMCGDQQSSMFAAGTEPGNTKVTFGTGTFIMQILDGFYIDNNFFTTLVPLKDGGVRYAVEAKIALGSKDADPLIGHKEEMDKFLHILGRKVSENLNRLPKTPPFITIDGGITQAEGIETILKEETGIEARKQSAFEGTALGAALLAE